ncbi:apolipoprotein N-acyltransferase [Synechococcales cyanobacterium C]|uniref:Apolipoprotein N-acyltransferase n=2 Tax=Petrachloros TaxID=2918834 RepID=A0A8K2A799_9CYAN|nr:apolipoprotein N-acyltransferase [Petrachloros mirabilis ULC683]
MGLPTVQPHLWGLAWLALAPLWWLICRYRWPQAFGLGVLWGVAYHGSVLSWITGLHPLTWLGVPWLASVAIAATCWGLITLWGALMVGIWALGLVKLTQACSPGVRIGLGVTLWCLLEWLWSQSPLWWTALNLTQSPSNLVVLHLGQISGPVTVAAVIVAVNGLGAEAFRKWHADQRWRRPYLYGALGLFLGAHLLGWSLYRQPLAAPASAQLRIGIVQGNIPTRVKLTPLGLQQATQVYTQGYEQLVAAGVDAVLMPEGAFPIRWPHQPPQALLTALRTQGVPLWVGTFLPQGDRITQSLAALDSNGQVLSRYDKVKLVPLGEYIPWEGVFGGLVNRLSPIEASMVPGRLDQQFQTPWGSAIAAICYDSAFANIFRHQAQTGGSFILTAANNDPYSARMMAQTHAQNVMRAIETDRWAVQATNTGYSSLIDPHGQTRWQSGLNTPEVYVGELARRTTQTLYVQWGSWLLLPWMGMSALGLFRSRLGRCG